MRRSFGVGGYGVTIDVRDKRAATPWSEQPLVRTADPHLVLREPPPLQIADRTAEEEFARSFAEDPSRYWHPLDDDLGEDAGHVWYHSIEFPDGTVTPGMFDHRPLVPHYGLPADLRNKRALDVGSGDGFWAFELERRGAEVTSLDIEHFSDTDYPIALQRVYQERPTRLSFRRGMEIAHRRLNSKVKLVNRPVYELDPDDVGTFDFVHAGDILLHLRDPALALQRIRTVADGEVLFADLFEPGLDEAGVGTGLMRFRGGWTDATWWSPSLSALAQMVADAGFRDVELVTTYRLAPRGLTDGPWRAVLRACT
jgi:tRNA (mo5U34)-methyltransferase